MTIRTRFAPSPTGFLHVGGVRTALFAWLVARQSGGKFVLRIEDTDQKRLEPGSMQHIQDSLAWLGILWDEGPNQSGPYGPYQQSERLAIYKKWANRLVEEGRAYADPYSPAQVQSFREQAQAAKKPFLYRNHRPENPPEWDGSQPLRLKSEPQSYTWHDEVMGDLSSGPEVIDDIILMKSDGYPTYNFAHIVDDAEMKITHVIRGQEFISSMPNYLNLYDALGLERPVFATMPHIMNEQGNKKLSKRDGAKDILDYREEGYLPEAMRNFLATLGWNDGTEQEVFSTDELIDKFSLTRIQRSGARFDEQRLTWLNGQHIRLLYEHDPAGLYQILTPIGQPDPTQASPGFWPTHAYSVTREYREKVLGLAHDRLKFLNDMRQFDYFFAEPTPRPELISDNKQLKKLNEDEQYALLKTVFDSFSATTIWNSESIQTILNDLLRITGSKPGVLFSLIRIVTTWAPFSPQLNDTLALIGREKTLARIQLMLDK